MWPAAWAGGVNPDLGRGPRIGLTSCFPRACDEQKPDRSKLDDKLPPTTPLAPGPVAAAIAEVDDYYCTAIALPSE